MIQKEVRYFLLVGDEDNWVESIKENIWGFSFQSRGSWNYSSEGDFLAFYVTRPIKKIIGFGKINTKFIDDTPIWPEEKIFGGRYIFRYRFEIFHISDDWKNGIPSPKNVILNQSRILLDKKLFSNLVKSADKKWKTKIHDEIFKRKKMLKCISKMRVVTK